VSSGALARAGDALDFIITDALGGGGGGEKGEGSDGGEEGGVLQNIGRTMLSVQRFMRSLQN